MVIADTRGEPFNMYRMERMNSDELSFVMDYRRKSSGRSGSKHARLGPITRPVAKKVRKSLRNIPAQTQPARQGSSATDTTKSAESSRKSRLGPLADAELSPHSTTPPLINSQEQAQSTIQPVWKAERGFLQIDVDEQPTIYTTLPTVSEDEAQLGIEQPSTPGQKRLYFDVDTQPTIYATPMLDLGNEAQPTLKESSGSDHEPDDLTVISQPTLYATPLSIIEDEARSRMRQSPTTYHGPVRRDGEEQPTTYTTLQSRKLSDSANVKLDKSGLRRLTYQSSHDSSSHASYDSLEDEISETNSDASELSKDTIDVVNQRLEEEAFLESKRLMAPPLDDDLPESERETLSDEESQEEQESIAEIPFQVESLNSFGQSEHRIYFLQLKSVEVRNYRKWAQPQGHHMRHEADERIRQPIARTTIRRRPPEKFILPAYAVLWDFCNKLQNKHIEIRTENVRLKRKLSKLIELPVAPEFMLHDEDAGLHGVEHARRKLEEENSQLQAELEESKRSAAVPATQAEQDAKELLEYVGGRLKECIDQEVAKRTQRLKQQHEVHIQVLQQEKDDILDDTANVRGNISRLAKDLEISNIHLNEATSEKEILIENLDTLRKDYDSLNQKTIDLEIRYKELDATYRQVRSVPQGRVIRELRSECEKLRLQRDEALNTANFGLWSTQRMLKTQMLRDDESRLQAEQRSLSKVTSHGLVTTNSSNSSISTMRALKRGRSIDSKSGSLQTATSEQTSDESEQSLAKRRNQIGPRIHAPSGPVTTLPRLAPSEVTPTTSSSRQSNFDSHLTDRTTPNDAQHNTLPAIDVDWILAAVDDDIHLGTPDDDKAAKRQNLDPLIAKVSQNVTGFGKGRTTRDFKSGQVLYAYFQAPQQFCVVEPIHDNPSGECYILLKDDIVLSCQHGFSYEQAPYIVTKSFIMLDGKNPIYEGDSVYCAHRDYFKQQNGAWVSVTANDEYEYAQRCIMTVDSFQTGPAPDDYISDKPCFAPYIQPSADLCGTIYTTRALVLQDCAVYQDVHETAELFQLSAGEGVLVASMKTTRKHILCIHSQRRNRSGYIDSAFVHLHDQAWCDSSDVDGALFALLTPKPVVEIPEDRRLLGSEPPAMQDDDGKAYIEGDPVSDGVVSNRAVQGWVDNKTGTNPKKLRFEDVTGWRRGRVHEDWTSGWPTGDSYILRNDRHALPKRWREALNFNPIGPRQALHCKTRFRSISDPPEPKIDADEDDFDKMKYIIKHAHVGRQRVLAVADGYTAGGYCSDHVTKPKKNKKRKLEYRKTSSGKWKVEIAGAGYDRVEWPYEDSKYQNGDHFPIWGGLKFRKKQYYEASHHEALLPQILDPPTIWAGGPMPERLNLSKYDNPDQIVDSILSLKMHYPAVVYNVLVRPEEHNLGQFQIACLRQVHVENSNPDGFHVELDRPFLEVLTSEAEERFCAPLEDIVVDKPFFRVGASKSKPQVDVVCIQMQDSIDGIEYWRCLDDNDCFVTVPATDLSLHHPCYWLPYEEVLPRLSVANDRLAIQGHLQTWDLFCSVISDTKDQPDKWLDVEVGELVSIRTDHPSTNEHAIFCKSYNNGLRQGLLPRQALALDLALTQLPVYLIAGSGEDFLQNNWVVLLKGYSGMLLVLSYNGTFEWIHPSEFKERYQTQIALYLSTIKALEMAGVGMSDVLPQQHSTRNSIPDTQLTQGEDSIPSDGESPMITKPQPTNRSSIETGYSSVSPTGSLPSSSVSPVHEQHASPTLHQGQSESDDSSAESVPSTTFSKSTAATTMSAQTSVYSEDMLRTIKAKRGSDPKLPPVRENEAMQEQINLDQQSVAKDQSVDARQSEKMSTPSANSENASKDISTNGKAIASSSPSLPEPKSVNFKFSMASGLLSAENLTPEELKARQTPPQTATAHNSVLAKINKPEDETEVEIDGIVVSPVYPMSARTISGHHTGGLGLGLRMLESQQPTTCVTPKMLQALLQSDAGTNDDHGRRAEIRVKGPQDQNWIVSNWLQNISDGKRVESTRTIELLPESFRDRSVQENVQSLVNVHPDICAGSDHAKVQIRQVSPAGGDASDWVEVVSKPVNNDEQSQLLPWVKNTWGFGDLADNNPDPLQPSENSADITQEIEHEPEFLPMRDDRLFSPGIRIMSMNNAYAQSPSMALVPYSPDPSTRSWFSPSGSSGGGSDFSMASSFADSVAKEAAIQAHIRRQRRHPNADVGRVNNGIGISSAHAYLNVPRIEYGGDRNRYAPSDLSSIESAVSVQSTHLDSNPAENDSHQSSALSPSVPAIVLTNASNNLSDHESTESPAQIAAKETSIVDTRRAQEPESSAAQPDPGETVTVTSHDVGIRTNDERRRESRCLPAVNTRPFAADGACNKHVRDRSPLRDDFARTLVSAQVLWWVSLVGLLCTALSARYELLEMNGVISSRAAELVNNQRHAIAGGWEWKWFDIIMGVYSETW